MSPNIRNLLLIAVAITVVIVIGGPIIDWFDGVSDMLQTSNSDHQEVR